MGSNLKKVHVRKHIFLRIYLAYFYKGDEFNNQHINLSEMRRCTHFVFKIVSIYNQTETWLAREARRGIRLSTYVKLESGTHSLSDKHFPMSDHPQYYT